MAVAGEHVMELEWEEWDGKSPFLHHCLAGSFAGVAEHVLLYPFDTLKTHLQSYCADCPVNKAQTSMATSDGTMLGALRSQFSNTSFTASFLRLWRGAQVMAVGCVPAHAMYFSSYETMKGLFLQRDHANLGALGSTVAGASAALVHDSVMVPVDTIKQRMQLGYYKNMGDAVRNMVKVEGAAGLYRAFPVTLATNLPYGAIMVTTNESLREFLMKQHNSNVLDVKTTLLAGCGAGMVAAALTTPLDRVKTRLQTQGLGIVLDCEVVGKSCPKLEDGAKYKGLSDAFQSIVREEGYRGLFRGMAPRLMTHTPAVAISWTTYEAAKLWLSSSL
jgi:solute carrier family 25 iron transporter 28/37